MFKRTLLCILIAACCFGSAVAIDDDLPDIGSPSDSVLSKDQELAIGRSIYKGLRDAGQMATDLSGETCTAHNHRTVP